MRRSGLTAVVVGALVAAIIPAGASAATTIGETFTPPPNAVISGGVDLLQTTSPGGQYAAPSPGVITAWSFQASAASPPQNLKLKVARHAGGTDYTIVGQSPPEDPPANALSTYTDVRIPVRAGDLIGLHTGMAAENNVVRFADATYTVHQRAGDLQPGQTETFTGPLFFQLDVSAKLEADCDKDGLGDETQDSKLVGSCSTLTCKGEPLTDVGTDGADELIGTENRDVISGLGGRDKIRGLAGKDRICGGKGKDKLIGGRGKDKLYGQKGKDKLRGGGGRDRCVGGKKDDSAKKCEVEKSI